MTTSYRNIHILRILLIFLILVIAATIVTFFRIRATEHEQITYAMKVLKIKDRNLLMMEQGLQNLYEADNDFWLYALTYDADYLREYSADITNLTRLLDSLRISLEPDTAGLLSVEGASENLLRKEDLASGFLRLKRLADSLLYTAGSIHSVRSGRIPAPRVSIPRYYPDLSVMSKVNEKGDTLPLRPGADLTLEEMNQIVSGQMNLYYQNQLRLQKSYRYRIDKREEQLILTNKELMGDLKEVMNQINGHVAARNDLVHGNALNAIDQAARNINYTSLISLAIVCILLFLIIVTIRQIIRYQKQIIAARKKALEEAAEKGRFLAYMSHELRTPLTSIVGFTEQLKHTSLDPEQEKYIHSMQASSEMLLAAVNDILDLSKLDAGKMKFFHVPFYPLAVVEQVLNSLRPAAEKKGLKVVLEKLIGEDTLFSGDEMRLKQVLINVINNAIKYTERGEITIVVSKEPCDRKQCLQVRVTDTGIGIPRNRLEDIFSEYGQVHTPSVKKWIIGTGLGLPICKKIVEQQGGRIWAESQLGKGSAFTFIIPYDLCTKPTTGVEPPEERIDPSLFRGKRILIVEDTEVNRVLLEAIFRQWMVNADLATNGREALTMIGKQTYDMVLTDVNMPEMDGIDLTKKIRRNADPVVAKIPVIILTANILQDEMEHFQRAGVTDYLMKPFLMNDLYQVVRKHLN